MIRDSNRYAKVRPLSAILLALCFFLVAAPVATHAGDQDGLGGYSMQLKRKYFDATGTGIGGNGQVIYPDPKSEGTKYAPETLAAETSSPRWLVRVSYYYALFTRWWR